MFLIPLYSLAYASFNRASDFIYTSIPPLNIRNHFINNTYFKGYLGRFSAEVAGNTLLGYLTGILSWNL